MDASTEPSLELLAITSPNEFVPAFLKALGISQDMYSRNGSSARSTGATLDGLFGWRRDKVPMAEGLVLKCVESEGGGEGEGESVSRVYAVVKNGIEIAHFTTNGYYSSDYGTDWDDIYTTVYPRQVVVTQYFTSKE